ncbi:MAG: hypothetical protein K6E93_08015 [Bacteroidales bacterium]|nr:hypothetical protein [Bacteroidales bacterium]
MKKDLYKDAQKALKDYNKMEVYRIQEDILQRLKKDYPDHKNRAAVEVKVKLLNLLYSTYILATNRMAEHIFGIKGIDGRLKNGDHTLVKQIAGINIDGKDYDFYSFATKYCAYHNPEAFPIYDNIVSAVFTKLFEDGKLEPYTCTRKQGVKNEYSRTAFAAKLRDYDFYIAVYNRFMELYGLKGKLTYREVDAYLWGAYKVAGADFEIEELAPLDKTKIVEVYI